MKISKTSLGHTTARVDEEYTTLQGAEGVTTAINTQAPYQGEGESAVLPKKQYPQPTRASRHQEEQWNRDLVIVRLVLLLLFFFFFLEEEAPGGSVHLISRVRRL